MELDEIRENYRNFEDYKIEKIATEDVTKLREGVIDILKEEIQRRDLPKSLINGIDAQTKELTEKEFTDYLSIIRNHTCPKCNSKTKKLNGSIVSEVVSVIFFTNYTKNLKIACSDCLDELNNKAIGKSLILGWWGFPWGPIYTIKSILLNTKMKKGNHTSEPNEILQGFVLENIGYIETNKNNPEKITQLLNKTNNKIE
jgi:hypothetical protein